jgi:hypothetical protein
MFPLHPLSISQGVLVAVGSPWPVVHTKYGLSATHILGVKSNLLTKQHFTHILHHDTC